MDGVAAGQLRRVASSARPPKSMPGGAWSRIDVVRDRLEVRIRAGGQLRPVARKYIQPIVEPTVERPGCAYVRAPTGLNWGVRRNAHTVACVVRCRRLDLV